MFFLSGLAAASRRERPLPATAGVRVFALPFNGREGADAAIRSAWAASWFSTKTASIEIKSILIAIDQFDSETAFRKNASDMATPASLDAPDNNGRPALHKAPFRVSQDRQGFLP
ncbi:hypothetical protein [Ralstonia solanacearum]|uniref:hypothetical protein n=1 Tax=Ralstonia solanacearum TaxID=305 RepID=UPI0001816974|nr:hypothetical protein [Ralstonia solanacearum]MDC6180186.1 hypothetical protein [Ralstonia solanacearum]MDC6213304.1 hypothetical protein [Ralstonia solanacearum]MDC6241622.1 hypothetical protein [Ralstonia solanacearum]MDD7803350.1 hypothetical protein [Ralstonia solanacearum]